MWKTPLIQECLPSLYSPNARYPTKRTFVHYNCKKTFFTQSFFPFTIKLWDSLDRNLKGLDLNEFKSKIKEIFRPPSFKHYNVGHKLYSQWHAHLRLKRSNLNTHLHQIGLAPNPACKCGQAPLESVKHFLIHCKLYEQPRIQLFAKLEGLLELKFSKYSTSSLVDIILFGEKPHLYDKFLHNKFIFLAVQKFLAQTKRFHFTVEHTNADQPNQADKHYPHNNPIHTSP